MADIQINPKRNGRDHVTPRIDLTPMVDLGFLLITFFMMTTTMREHKQVDIQMPFTTAPPDRTAYYESSAITLLPAKDHKIFYYEGKFDPLIQLHVVNNEMELHKILMQKQRTLLSRENPDERHLQVLIKSHATATVQDIINLFDEMDLLKVKNFAMVDIYPMENEKINDMIR
jgi:biopolymer transport protein ExbD